MRHLITMLAVCVATSSCTSVLEKDPFDSINSDNFFKTEADLELYANGFIQRMIPAWDAIVFGDNFSDIAATNASTVYLTGAWTADDQGGWGVGNWQDLRNINYFLDHIDRAEVSDEIRQHYEGVGRFWRAWFYYDKVRTFGDVPWYEHALDPADETLYKGRDAREFVMAKVLEDLTYAATHCVATKDASASNITKWVALAFKSRVALFEGTYRKYHTELGLTATADGLLQEAAVAARTLMDAGVYTLVNSSANLESQYRSLFTSETINSMEVLLANNFNDALSRWHSATWHYNSGSAAARTSLTKQFINTYLYLDGSRFTDQPDYDRMVFDDEVHNRDYRLKQTIRTAGYTRTVGGVAGTPVAPNFAVTLTGYHPIKWSLDHDRHDGSANSYNSLPILRYAEVLLNYAEAMAELGQMDESVWNTTIRPLRERAGVDGSAPETYDPYLQAYYLNQTNDKWILEVRRERGIELVLESLRYDDIMRWKLGELLTRPWHGLYVPALDQPLDLNADGTYDVVVSAAPLAGINYYNVVLADRFTLTDGTHGNLIYHVVRNWEDKKYLRPIPTSAITDNSNLSQNPDW
ncbi:RagB/SusD family nutrient uptake outer membrane protein [Parapedobacter sp. ISTM3]|uniref:RagB/SusD family nutrient uptake outer membrane protein n=1 Tax=Parapedobacter sp. ISTM3 TaxID=2800130 RepID=UPI00190593FB|nr:RagB/SusD family nutrient uptake outer membrane protein [Parapedobacter sp. ISTM3]MBK1438854.1 RagB/SusD family nutrient uptake outer membrane protein [Parapedobacter sp. ISTM3]